jgi:Spy/CpxP family protein refolding chaperone
MNAKTKQQIRRERGHGRKLFWGIVLVITIVSLVWATNGFGRDHARRHGAILENAGELHESLSYALDYIDVTDEQETAVRTLVDELSPELMALTEGKEAIRSRLIAALSVETVDPEDFEVARAEATALTVRTVELTMDATQRLAQILTPEQRAELVKHWRVK